MSNINPKDWHVVANFIIPIVLVLTFALIFSVASIVAYDYTAEDPPESIAPVQDEDNPVVGGLGNALFYVFFAFVGGIILLILIREQRFNFLQLLFAVSFGLSGFLFGLLLFLPLVWIFYTTIYPVPVFDPYFVLVEYHTNNVMLITLVVSLLYGIFGFSVVMFERFKTKWRHNFLMVTSGALLGSVFGLYFRTIEIVPILIGLSLYDIYAVFKGPLGMIFGPMKEEAKEKEEEIAKEEEEEISRTESEQQKEQVKEETKDSEETTEEEETEQESFLSLPVYMSEDISIGLGDFVFYSALIAQATLLTAFGWPNKQLPLLGMILYSSPIWLSFFGIVLGAYLTLRLLEKIDMLPALPISIFLGLLGLGSGVLITILI